MKKILASIAVVGLVLSSGYVNAQSAEFKPGFYLGVELGYQNVKNEAQSNANELVRVLGGSSSVTQDTGLFDGRIFAGYKVVEYIDLELGYTQTGNITSNFSGRAGNGVAYSGNANTSYSGADYSVLFRPSIASGFNGLFLRVGGTYLTQKNDLTITGTSTATLNDSTSGSGYIVGLGYDIPINPTFNARIAYNYLGNVAGISNNYSNRFSVGFLGKF